MVRALWSSVDRLIDLAPSVADLRAHRLHLLACERWRGTGQPVPAGLALEELIGVQRAVGALDVLERIREVVDGRLVVLKGPVVAANYLRPAQRHSVDLDVLVDEPERAQRDLLRAGFVAIGPYNDRHYDGLHHLRPLALPNVVAPHVELHRRLNWVSWSAPPERQQLVERMVDADLGIPGVLTLDPAAHALVLAAHSWGDLPLRRVSDLVDIAALLPTGDRDEAARLSDAWRLGRVWQTTAQVVDGLLGDAPPSPPLTSWGRNLLTARDCTVLEEHLRRWVGPFWALPRRRAMRRALLQVLHDSTPTPGESWGQKVTRVRAAAAHPTRPRAQHRDLLGPDAHRPRHVRRS